MSFIRRLIPQGPRQHARSAANPNLEVFKFTTYVGFPLLAMLYFGDPNWYHDYVQPFRDAFSKPELQANRPPRSPEEARERLEAYRAERQMRRQQPSPPEVVAATQQRLV